MSQQRDVFCQVKALQWWACTRRWRTQTCVTRCWREADGWSHSWS